MSSDGGARAVVAAVVLLVASTARAVTLADPTHFQVKRTWTAADVGVGAPLGGLGFSAGRTALFAVGVADDPSSRLRSIPVTRDPGTGEVIALGSSSLVFNGGNPDPTDPSGLDAGLAFGPSGTSFYTYFPANYLAERPGGTGGSESTFLLTGLGVDGSVGGIAFSPWRTDPGTGFAVYDSVPYQNQTGWFQLGGTSAGAPQWAAIIAVANQLRSTAGKSRLTSSSFQATGSIYASGARFDVGVGSNGTCGDVCIAAAGFDAVTGLGSPRAGIDASLASAP